jgi:8-oxo-dGTP pyrophosphatase MutT (NUDIX family)
MQDDAPAPPVRLDLIRNALAALGEPGLDPVANLKEAPKRSSILVPIVELHGEAAVVVTKRPPTMHHHSNDWVFPGGRYHPDDGQAVVTALREAEEELGFARRRTEILGQLTTRGPLLTGYVIEVFVGLVDLGELSPDPREVADVALLPIGALMAPEVYRRSFILPEHIPGPTSTGAVLAPVARNRPLHFFEIRPGEDIWGPQGDILFELLSAIALAPD